ncbi:MAG: response regulator [Chitinophagaceae bacterium]|nr:MAG: response regulator [Chitinophagaceae bacterium]
MLEDRLQELQQKIAQLEEENAMLRRDSNYKPSGDTVSVPEDLRPIFDMAQQTVSEYFRHLKMDPTKGTIEINDQRYVLVRASALSIDFLSTIQNLYGDRGETEAMAIGKNFLFDIAHVIGMNDAKNFHEKMNLTDPISKLSAGTVHFAYSGWAYVDIVGESNPSPDENFYLIYHHPYSFEADSWKRAGKLSNTPVCIMNAGYSSGWCEESFNLPLTAVEVSCRAKGDDQCTFIMSPPEKIQEHLEKYHAGNQYLKRESYEVPTFFDRKRVEEEMQRSKTLAEDSDKAKSDFIANISHELRTPLGAILGFADLLKKTSLTAVQKDYLEAVSSSGNSLLSIINDILDLSKIDAGKFIIESIPFSIAELVHSIEVMFALKAAQKGIEFHCNVDRNIDHVVQGDPMRLTQILINLIGNAIKFTDVGGVYMNCELKREHADSIEVSFSVRDTGIGIDEEKTATIFERFTQADTNITRKYGGTGLGLAITKQLVELQSGHIELINHKGGAEFRFDIRYKKNQETQSDFSHNSQLNQSGLHSIKRILVVEDNVMNQKLASVILSANGFKITIADNGQQAIDILKEKQFDVILMDIQMPVMDGYQATKTIRNELLLSTPIIAMTAHALSGEKEKCISAGMNDYLSKPYKEIDLMTKLGSVENESARPLSISDNSRLIDLHFLRSQTRNNKKFILEMMGLFIQQHPKEMATLKAAIKDSDYMLIAKTTHTIRNTISFFGLDKKIGEELMQIEKMAREELSVNEINLLYQIVEPVCFKAIEELKNFDSTMLD